MQLLPHQRLNYLHVKKNVLTNVGLFCILQYKKRQRLVDAQKRLEEEHRKEEDRLLQEITQDRRQEVRRLSDEVNKEWQFKLKELTEKYEHEIGNKSKKMKDNEKKVGLNVIIFATL